VVVVADHEGGEAVAEQVAASAVLAVERLGVGAVDPVDTGGEALEQRFDDQVVVVRQQTEDMAVPVFAPHGLGEQGEEEPPVLVVEHDCAPGDASGGDVVDARWREEVAR